MGFPRPCCLVIGIAGVAALVGGSGCSEVDGWMADPTKVGRWERTPTTTPILTRLASIEGAEDQFVQFSMAQPEDLIPEAFEYRITSGDVLNIVIWNLPREFDSTPYQRQVDTRGMISLPQLGQLAVEGHTIEGAKEVISDAMQAAELGNNPIVDLSLSEQRELRFSVLGAVYRPGPYQIPASDFRLLEAITAAGGPVETQMASHSYIKVIRQIPLEDRVSGGRRATPADPSDAAPAGGENLVDIINDLSRPAGEVPPPPPPPATDPTMPPAGDQPATPPPGDPGGAPGVLGTTPARPAPIALIENGTQPEQPGGAGQAQPRTEQPPPSPAGDSPWVFLNGEWVQPLPEPMRAEPGDGVAAAPRTEGLVTQRVIRIPIAPLLSGDARYNIVVRPGDVISVPSQPVGLIFVAGEVVRVGTYSLSEQMTLSAAITAAGGLSAIAIPERVDLTRHVGGDRLATIRLNYKAISERTHPDIYLKANDQINVGTNFWATPMAIIRNGFRATYGFGFLLDRNFGPDVFGPEPIDDNGVFD